MLSPTEVRRCARCSQPAAICVRDWKHTTWGVETGSSTRDFACQSCGHAFTLVPKVEIIVPAVFAVIFSFTICGGLLFGGWALYRGWPYLRAPIVPGAPYPPAGRALPTAPGVPAIAPRFRPTEPLRRCHACSGIAVCRQVTRRTTNMIPTGTEHAYACTKCSAKFSIHSPLSIVLDLCAALLLFVLGIATVAVGIGVLFLVLCLFMLGVACWSVASYVRHPVVPEPEPPLDRAGPPGPTAD